MIAKFKTESSALDFMSLLMEQNNQGVKQILYGWTNCGADVEYSFSNVIHDDVYTTVSNYLYDNEGT